jgi:hypothetical protein
VLSHDILAKFKNLKDSLLSTAILCQNLLGKTTIAEFKSLIQFILESKSLDLKMKVKTLLPSEESKKVNFTQYYNILNDSEIHSLVLRFVVESIIHDEKSIVNNWNLID